MFNTFYFQNHAVYEIRWESTVELDRPQMTVSCMCIACRVTKSYICTLEICNTWFYTAAVVALMHLNVTLICTLPGFFPLPAVHCLHMFGCSEAIIIA